jgi:hypothetical protein
VTGQKLTPGFRKGIASIARGEVLIAPLRAYLYNPDFRGFNIEVRGIGRRQPDFHFHPSSHPSWNDRSLYIWMTQPELLVEEMLEPTSVLSMTAGSLWHAIIQKILVDIGLLDAVEVPVEDALRKTRGNMDGVRGNEIFELKTMKDLRLMKIKSVADYLEMFPTYHLQANEYMRMSGIPKERVLLMALTFPYEMREFVIEYDPFLAYKQEQKYERVLQAVADGQMPMCSGCAKAAECPARAVCAAEQGGARPY